MIVNDSLYMVINGKNISTIYVFNSTITLYCYSLYIFLLLDLFYMHYDSMIVFKI